MTGVDISYDSRPENRSVKESLTFDGVNGFFVLLSFPLISGSSTQYFDIAPIFFIVFHNIMVNCFKIV